MSYTLDITTEMIRTPNAMWTLAEHLPAGKYVLSGSGRYYEPYNNRWWNFNDGPLNPPKWSIVIGIGGAGWGGASHPVRDLFQYGKTEIEINVQDDAYFKVLLWDVINPGSAASDNLQYTLRSVGEPLPYICKTGTRVLYGGTLRKDPIGLQLISSNQIHAPFTALLEINGTQYTITDGTYVDIPISGQPNGKVGVFDIGLSGACIDIITPTPVTVPVLPPFPGDPGCVWPQFEWSFNYIYKILEFIACHIKHIIAILGWFKDVVVASFDYVMQFILYFVSLKWLTDFTAKFFDELDTWLSAKFGIDKDKPFLEELVKKVWNIITGGASEAFKEGKRRMQ